MIILKTFEYDKKKIAWHQNWHDGGRTKRAKARHQNRVDELHDGVTHQMIYLDCAVVFFFWMAK